MMHLRKFFTLIIGATLITMFQSCDNYTIQYPEVEYDSFSASVQPIFDADCIACHGGGINPNLSSGASHLALTQNGYVDTENPEESTIYQKLQESSHTAYTLNTNKEIILAWITAGAPND